MVIKELTKNTSMLIHPVYVCNLNSYLKDISADEINNKYKSNRRKKIIYHLIKCFLMILGLLIVGTIIYKTIGEESEGVNIMIRVISSIVGFYIGLSTLRILNKR